MCEGRGGGRTLYFIIGSLPNPASYLVLCHRKFTVPSTALSYVPEAFDSLQSRVLVLLTGFDCTSLSYLLYVTRHLIVLKLGFLCHVLGLLYEVVGTAIQSCI